ncbi:hypothetical protein, partial [Burkholderia ubonensis]|uniref:hypothetical protein n=1 Tax=Burkholderia ubonensis TaxID=101571 RepID=UPI0039EA9C82
DLTIGSLSSSAHTYRLLIFKERFCEKTVFLSSAALSAAEKRDYEHCFAVRQQLFYKLRCDCGVHLPRQRRRVTTTPALPRFPLPRRVAVSAKEA